MNPIMDEQDEIDMLKAKIRAKSEAILRLKREANALIKVASKWPVFYKEREALRKALSEIN